MARSATRAIFTVASGTLVGQVIGALVMPVVSRLYTPAEFGQFAALSAILITVGAVAAGRFDLAVPIPRFESRAYAVVAAGLLSTLLATAVVALFALGLPRLASQVSGGADPAAWVIGSIGVLGLGGTTVLNQLAIRQGRFGAVARRNAAQPALLAISQVALGLVGAGALGLVGGFALGNAVGFASLAVGAGLTRRAAKVGMHRRAVASVARRFSRFPMLLVPSGFLNAAGVQAPVIVIAYLASAQPAGWYGLTQRVLALPVSLAGLAIAQVYLSEASRSLRQRPSDVLPLFLSASRRLLIVGVAVAVVVFVLAPPVFPALFGQQWAASGRYAQALSLSLAAQMVAAPLSQTLVLAERQGRQLAWDVGRLVAIVAALVIGYGASGSVLTAVWASSLTSVAAYAIAWFQSYSAACALGDGPTG